MSGSIREGYRTPGDGNIDGYEVRDRGVGNKLGSSVIRQCTLLNTEQSLQHPLAI